MITSSMTFCSHVEATLSTSEEIVVLLIRFVHEGPGERWSPVLWRVGEMVGIEGGGGWGRGWG